MNSPLNSTAPSLKVSPRLTPTEKRIAEMLLQAKRNREMASVMKISHGATKMHMSHIFSKFGLHNHWNTGAGDGRVRLALLIHEYRQALGVRCQACGEI